MTLDDVRSLEGRHVSVALANHSRVDNAVLEGVVDGERLWLHTQGKDVFLVLHDVLDLWEC